MSTINSPGLCPDPIPDHIQEELTTLRERVRELKEQVQAITKNAIDLLVDGACESHSSHVKSISFSEFRHEEIAMGCKRCQAARILELEEALIKASKTFPNPELKEQADRIKELEEVMPDFEALREAAFSAFYYIGNDNGLCQMADRIEKVMTKPTSEK